MNDSSEPEIGTDPDDPKELSTVADDERPLSHAEALVAGIVPGMAVYGDSSIEPNADDHRDSESA
jgi:hypothetical protein